MRTWEWKKERSRAIIEAFIIVAIVYYEPYLRQQNCLPEWLTMKWWGYLNYFIPFWALSALIIYYAKSLLYHLFDII